MEAGIAVDALVGVDDTALRRVTDARATDDVSRHRDVEDLADRAPWEAADLLGEPPRRLVARRDPRRVGLAMALLRRQLRAEEPALAEDGE